MKVIDCEVYPFQILVSFESSKDSFLKKSKKYFTKEEILYMKKESFKFGKSIMFERGVTLLWMPRKPKTPFDKGTLAHEIFHCACFIMDRVGIGYGDNSDEAFAYLIGFLTKRIHEEFKV